MFDKPLVKKILESASLSDKWTLQGFGMLRLHLSDEYRLNIWDSLFKVPGVSEIHNHPWDFASLVVVGELANTRFDVAGHDLRNPNYVQVELIPGAGGGLTQVPCVPIKLRMRPPERIRSGEYYTQEAKEIHLSSPVDGTVTLNRRRRLQADLANGYYPIGTQWVSAEPRTPTDKEFGAIIEASLMKWF